MNIEFCAYGLLFARPLLSRNTTLFSENLRRCIIRYIEFVTDFFWWKRTDSSYLCPTLRRNCVFPSLPPCIFTMIFLPGQSPTAPHSACCSPSLFSAPAQAQHNQVPTSHTASGDACHGRRPISLEQLDCELDSKMNEVRQHSSCPLSTR
jgi:hypothetical protein